MDGSGVSNSGSSKKFFFPPKFPDWVWSWTGTSLPLLWNYLYEEFKLIYHAHIIVVHNVLYVTKRERKTSGPKKMLVPSTMIPRLTKIIRSGITFVS